MCLRVQACGTQFRGFLCFMQVATVSTAPNHFAISFEYSSGFKIVSKIFVAFTVLFFGNGNSLIRGGNFIETFFASNLCEGGIHFSPLVFFTGYCVAYIF